jgi:hypothetical protein
MPTVERRRPCRATAHCIEFDDPDTELADPDTELVDPDTELADPDTEALIGHAGPATRPRGLRGIAAPGWR